ncbi:MAG: hypothetical protein ACYC61_00710 [Isosphaeraceae bacterium]
MVAGSCSNPIEWRTESGRARSSRPGALALLVVCGLALPAAAQSKPGTEGPPSDVRREVARSLKASGDRLATLVGRVAQSADDGPYLQGVPISMRLRTSQAEAEYLRAKADRDAAEISVREYTEGIRGQKENSIESKISLARYKLVHSTNLAAMAQSDDDKAWTELEVKGRELAYAAARMAKSNLTRYTAPRRTKELEAEAARCRNLERLAEAKWKALQTEEARLAKGAADRPVRSAAGRRGPAAVARAVALHERIMARFAEGAKEAESADVLLKEIREPTNGLETLVDEAEAAVAADDLARWKPLVRAALHRAPAGRDGR